MLFYVNRGRTGACEVELTVLEGGFPEEAVTDEGF